MKKLIVVLLVLLLLMICPIRVFASAPPVYDLNYKVLGSIYAPSEYVSKELQDVIFDVCDEYEDLDYDVRYLVIAIIERESKGQQYASSGTGDYGLMQIHLNVHRDRLVKLGVDDIYDIEGNIRVGVDLLDELMKTYSGWTNVLMHYNGVADASEKYVRGEYTDYAVSVMNRYYEIIDAVKECQKKNIKKPVKVMPVDYENCLNAGAVYEIGKLLHEVCI